MSNEMILLTAISAGAVVGVSMAFRFYAIAAAYAVFNIVYAIYYAGARL